MYSYCPVLNIYTKLCSQPWWLLNKNIDQFWKKLKMVCNQILSWDLIIYVKINKNAYAICIEIRFSFSVDGKFLCTLKNCFKTRLSQICSSSVGRPCLCYKPLTWACVRSGVGGNVSRCSAPGLIPYLYLIHISHWRRS